MNYFLSKREIKEKERKGKEDKKKMKIINQVLISLSSVLLPHLARSDPVATRSLSIFAQRQRSSPPAAFSSRPGG
ncbi:hypothetical protein EUGRSUZ_B00030 [Eucalyptus grandis]|uniref:Uncharacterized protein n=2 Tax=Eucalyptus grandis TaxID=71139 RepID=A0ACC3KJF1_EUCGR|nr:hypothetical protein EUGRSUZ_B00030 [Eucalyptus grandis]